MEPKRTAVGPGPRPVRRFAASLRLSLKDTPLPSTPRCLASAILCNAPFAVLSLRPNFACSAVGAWAEYLFLGLLVPTYCSLGLAPLVETLCMLTLPFLLLELGSWGEAGFSPGPALRGGLRALFRRR